MRALVQRVSRASVIIDDAVRGEIVQGYLVLLGIKYTDTKAQSEYLADKIAKLRVFEDAHGKMNRALADVDGKLLVVSQFTLYGNCKKGNRPSFIEAARPDIASELYEAFLARCRSHGIEVQTGEFGADMQVALCNDGPVTLMMDTEEMSH